MNRNLKIKTGFAAASINGLSLDEARVALFNALLARRYRQPFLFRIDDELGSHRSPNSPPEAQVMQDLSWLGIDWDEGPGTGGDHAPYFRSQRSPIYAAFYVKLIDMDLAFPCFCTARELEAVCEAQLESGVAPHYAGGCNRLNSVGRQKKIDRGLTAVLRFQPPEDGRCGYEDLLLGPHECQAEEVGAFVIRSRDGIARRLFTTAIDDALGGITHRFRSFREIEALPAQILLLQALGLPIPAYGHLPAMLPDESSRDGGSAPEAVTLGGLRERGYHPQAVLNWLARTGLSYDSEDLLDFDELAAGFHLSRIAHEPVSINCRELDQWQSRTTIPA